MIRNLQNGAKTGVDAIDYASETDKYNQPVLLLLCQLVQISKRCHADAVSWIKIKPNLTRKIYHVWL